MQREALAKSSTVDEQHLRGPTVRLKRHSIFDVCM
uniref:Uncharacterized protein n=1 Tax=Anguilla anguilla TaxID=7936 RepID=A0A0E9SSL3_ANGAN